MKNKHLLITEVNDNLQGNGNSIKEIKNYSEEYFSIENIDFEEEEEEGENKKCE